MIENKFTTDPKDWRETAERMTAEAAGVWQVVVMDALELAKISMQWLVTGDQWSGLMIYTTAELKKEMSALRRDGPRAPMCLLCDRTFYRKRMPGVWSLLVPNRDDPSSIMGSGICEKCCANHDTLASLRKTVAAAYTERFLPGSREIKINEQTGAA